MASEEATDVQDIWKLSTAKRRKLYRLVFVSRTCALHVKPMAIFLIYKQVVLRLFSKLVASPILQDG